MCGICGIVNKDIAMEVSGREITAMNRSLEHRGPDEEGQHVESNVGLGSRRLSIIDLSTGKQPVYNENESMVIVYNGEVYNYRDLRKNLIGKGYNFRTQSDTEVVLHLYEEYGENCLHHLNGMFAFAIYDKNRDRLFLARDRLGIKPVYYYEAKNKFIFASEIKAILLNDSVKRDLDYEAIGDFLNLSYIPAPKTVFKQIRKLPAGCYLYLNDGNIKIHEYWRPVPGQGIQGYKEADYHENLEELIKASVKRRLISEVPLGAFLSGGVDSSLIVGMMSELEDKPVQTFSIGFDIEKFNELPYAKMVSEHCNTNHHTRILSPKIEELLPELISNFDQPFADPSFLPTYLLSKVAHETVTVALSGDGGDELFGGYNRYADGVKSDKYDFLPSFIKDGIRMVSNGLSPNFKGSTRMRRMALDKEARYYDYHNRFPASLQRTVFSEDLIKKLDGYDSFEVFKKYFDEVSYVDDYLTKMQYVDIRTYLVDNNLEKVDKMSMLNSLEVRVPLLDHTVVEFAMNLPSSLKIAKGEKKSLLKKITSKYVPHDAVYRAKRGFSVPISAWFRENLKDYIGGILTEKKTLERGFVNPQGVNYLIDRNKKEERGYDVKLWNLLILELYMRDKIDLEAGSVN